MIARPPHAIPANPTTTSRRWRFSTPTGMVTATSRMIDDSDLDFATLNIEGGPAFRRPFAFATQTRRFSNFPILINRYRDDWRPKFHPEGTADGITARKHHERRSVAGGFSASCVHEGGSGQAFRTPFTVARHAIPPDQRPAPAWSGHLARRNGRARPRFRGWPPPAAFRASASTRPRSGLLASPTKLS